MSHFLLSIYVAFLYLLEFDFQLAQKGQLNCISFKGMQQCNGQRKYWNPNWTGSPPSRGSEVFVGKIPRDLFEDELVPVFEKV